MNEHKPDLIRRQFLMGLTAALGALAMTGVKKLGARAQTWTERLFLPLVEEKYSPPTPTAAPTQVGDLPLTNHAVVHVRHPSAAPVYTGGQVFYDQVEQTHVDAMALKGLQELTGRDTWADIWKELFGRVTTGGYRAGAKVAIKVNFNNTDRNGNSATVHNNDIDALPQPVLALIKSMVAHGGVSAGNIYVYDATHTTESSSEVGRIFPSYFTNRIQASCPGVKYIGRSGYNGALKPTFGKDASLTVQFSNGVKPRILADILYDATYLINVPILKIHQRNDKTDLGNFTSLGLKNHVGSIHYVLGEGSDHLHNYITNGDLSRYERGYNPLVEIAKNKHIRNKTILVMGDALYGTKWGAVSAAETNWSVFGNKPPSSLFFAVDPIAIDCVMTDVLIEELSRSFAVDRAKTPAYDALYLGQEAGLGVCEGTRSAPGGKPFQSASGSGYTKIAYKRIDMT